ncbi:MAG: YbaB/EbfC family nucleoid-associated protein [Phycisphaerae bacterium]|nr:YbaB/EbfC family nucleoid-associated protein [Phycisphaerae bacterium]
MFGNLGKMMKMAGQLKTNLPAVQEKIATSEFTAAAGDGAVTATVNGRLKLTDLRIAPQLLSDEATDAARLAELVTAAVGDAQDQAVEAMQQAVRELTGGEDIPGLSDML